MRGQLRQSRSMAPVTVTRKPKSATITIAVADWTGTSAVVDTGRLRVRPGDNIMISVATKTDEDNYSTAEVFCTQVGRNKLYFSAAEAPTSAITINVILL